MDTFRKESYANIYSQHTTCVVWHALVILQKAKEFLHINLCSVLPVEPDVCSKKGLSDCNLPLTLMEPLYKVKFKDK